MSVTAKVEMINGLAVESFTPAATKYEAPLLFVHGSSCGSWMWSNFIQYFTSRGRRCHALNLRGHHLSRPVEDWGAVGVEAYLEDVAEVISWIGQELILIGHSMGGVLVQKYAESHNPLKLILLHTSPPRQVLEKVDFDLFLKRGKEKGRVMGQKTLQSDGDREKLLGYMFDRGNVDEDVLETAHRKMGKESARAIMEMQHFDVNAEKITCPVYVLGFNLAKIGVDFPVDLSEELVRYYRARDYRIIEPGGHMFMLEKNWQKFAAVIEKWLLD